MAEELPPSTATVQEDAGWRHYLKDAKGKRILWIDIRKNFQCGVNDQILYSRDQDQTGSSEGRSTEWPEPEAMLEALRRLVKEDVSMVSSDRIDSVLWDVELGTQPTSEGWKALDGLSPAHLTISTGFYEDCNIVPLGELHHQWNDLQSLNLVGIASTDFMTAAPDVLSGISTLTLDVCYGLHLVPPNAFRLKELSIIQNNACDIFTSAINDNPRLAHTLENLVLLSSPGGHDFCYEYESQDFLDALKKCTNLQRFDFSTTYANELDIDLAADLPSSIEHLSLTFTRSLLLLHYFDEWMQKAADLTWLPNLKSFKMAVDSNSSVGGLAGDPHILHEGSRTVENPPDKFTPNDFDVEFQAKRLGLYSMLRETRPTIYLLT